MAKQIYMKGTTWRIFIFVFCAFWIFLVVLCEAVFGALAMHNNNWSTNTEKKKTKTETEAGGPQGEGIKGKKNRKTILLDSKKYFLAIISQKYSNK